MKINKKEFHECTRKLIKDPTLQKLETEDFIFIRPNGTITVRFKNIDKLTGYFTMEEIKNWKTLKIILNTLEKEMEDKNV
jgi:hypothetical protein